MAVKSHFVTRFGIENSRQRFNDLCFSVSVNRYVTHCYDECFYYLALQIAICCRINFKLCSAVKLEVCVCTDWVETSNFF